jgi:hypothetical protein
MNLWWYHQTKTGLICLHLRALGLNVCHAARMHAALACRKLIGEMHRTQTRNMRKSANGGSCMHRLTVLKMQTRECTQVGPREQQEGPASCSMLGLCVPLRSSSAYFMHRFDHRWRQLVSVLVCAALGPGRTLPASAHLTVPYLGIPCNNQSDFKPKNENSFDVLKQHTRDTSY